MYKHVFIPIALVTLIACGSKKDKSIVSNYPPTKKVNQVDTISGVVVNDPYRWLENDTVTETKDWVKAQNEITFGYLNSIPFRDALRKRLDELQNYERLSAPVKQGEYYYYTRNTGLQNQNVYYRKKGIDGAEELFLDPNTFSKDGTTALASTFFTSDGSMIALLIQEAGSDWRKVVILKTADKTQVGDTLRDLKGSFSWKGNEGFYYSNYDKPKGSQLSAKTSVQKVYYHSLSTSFSKDKVIFGGEQTPRRYIYVAVSEDQRYLTFTATNVSSGNELYIQDLKDPKGKLIAIMNNFDHKNSFIDNDGATLIVQTNISAPNSRIVAIDPAKPDPANWKELIPESEYTIQNTSTGGKKLLVEYLKDARSLVNQFDYKGKAEREIELPSIGSASGFRGKTTDKEVYYTFTSFTFPPSIYQYDIASGKSSLYAQPKVSFDPNNYETKQVFYTSKDGTKVPMFIVHKKGIELNGKNPTWLYAYGGFNISLKPGFNTSRILWLENGGIYASANLRGGGEYGEKWHVAGTKMNKQNVFDDFIAAGEYLISEKYTSSPYLAIAGGSNGGLLVGATMTQRPNLAKVALPAVGVMDMLRYHKFTSGAGWAYDYGTADDSKEMAEYLKKYSPLHALKPGTSYPATLVTTADHDDRVVPAHSYKFTATLQESQTGDNPTLIRIETNSGHGSSNLSKALDAIADEYSFAFYNMGITPPLLKKSM
jgi:prolyl oligopeptidase